MTLTIDEALRAMHARLDAEEGRAAPAPLPAEIDPAAALVVARGALAEIRDLVATCDVALIPAIATAALEATGGAS